MNYPARAAMRRACLAACRSRPRRPSPPCRFLCGLFGRSPLHQCASSRSAPAELAAIVRACRETVEPDCRCVGGLGWMREFPGSYRRVTGELPGSCRQLTAPQVIPTGRRPGDKDDGDFDTPLVTSRTDPCRWSRRLQLMGDGSLPRHVLSRSSCWPTEGDFAR